MKRILILVLAGLSALIVVGYAAGAWFVGKQVEATIDERYKALHDYAPFVTVSDRKYERGIFSSAETVTVNIAPVSGATRLRFIVTSRIKHLPLPGLISLSSATVDSKLVYADGGNPDVVEWTGGKDLATVHTAFNFNGGGSTTITVPAFNSARLSSDEATLKIDYSGDLAHYSMQGNAPRFAIMDKTGARVQFAGMHLDGDHQRIFPEVPNLYSGSDHFSIEQIAVAAPGMSAEAGLLKKLAVDVMANAGADREYIDITEKIGAGSIKVLGVDYGPAQFDLSVHHVHARTIARLSQLDWNALGKNSVASPQATEALTKDIETIFLHNPEVRVDRFSFTVPEGETVVSALFKVNDAQPGDFANPMALAGKAYVSVDFKAPEKFLSGLSQGAFASAMQQGGGFDKELARMLAEGYVTREGEYIKTRFELHDAKPWFNGKQYVPPSVARNPAPAAPARPPARKFRQY